MSVLLALVMGAAPVAPTVLAAKSPNRPRQGARITVAATITVGSAPAGIAIVHQGRRTLAFVSNSNATPDGTVSVINTQRRTVVGTTDLGENVFPSSVVASPNGQNVYVGTGAGIDVIDSSTFGVVNVIGATKSFGGGLAVSPNGRFLYADAGGQGPVSVFDAQSGAEVASLSPTVSSGGRESSGTLAVSPDGQRLYVGVFAPSPVVNLLPTYWVAVFDIKSLTQLTAFRVRSNPMGIAVSPDGQRLYVTSWGNFSRPFPRAGHIVQVFDTASLQLVGNVRVGDYPAAIAFTPDGQLAYVVNKSNPGTVAVVRTRDLTVVSTVRRVGLFCPSSVAVTPDGLDAYVTNTGLGAVCGPDKVQNTVYVLS